MKYKAILFVAASTLASISTHSLAANPILASLEKQGVQMQIISDNQLSQIKGAALISGQPHPNVVKGVNTKLPGRNGGALQII